jgi:hypothetical protein
LSNLILAYNIPLIYLLRGINILGCNKSLTIACNEDNSGMIGLPFIVYNTDEDSKFISFVSKKVNLSTNVYLILCGNRETDTKRISLIEKYILKRPFLLYHSLGPFKNIDDAYAKYSPQSWVSTSCSTKPDKNRSFHIPLYAIIGARNEEDIIYACIRNAFEQGCKKVFLIDNNSSDKTRQEATDAGAEIFLNYDTDQYYEMHRIRLMNDAVESISLNENHDKVWWLWLDADEFPRGPKDNTISQFLTELSDDIRVVGADVVNHFPTEKPYYRKRQHPGKFMPYGELFDCSSLKTKHCLLNHWKHPLHRFDKGKAQIRALSGFHTAHCCELPSEPRECITIHHFPFRDKDTTFARYNALCEKNDKLDLKNPQSSSSRIGFDDSVSIKKKSCTTRRYENLDYVYNGQWDKVCIGAGESPKIGVSLKKFSFK